MTQTNKLKRESLTLTDGSQLPHGAYLLNVSVTGKGSVLRLTQEQHRNVIMALGDE